MMIQVPARAYQLLHRQIVEAIGRQRIVDTQM